jgi:hypothetical protein
MRPLCGKKLHNLLYYAFGWWGCTYLGVIVTDSVTGLPIENATVTAFRHRGGVNKTIAEGLTENWGGLWLIIKNGSACRLRVQATGYNSSLDLSDRTIYKCSGSIEFIELTPDNV